MVSKPRKMFIMGVEKKNTPKAKCGEHRDRNYLEITAARGQSWKGNPPKRKRRRQRDGTVAMCSLFHSAFFKFSPVINNHPGPCVGPGGSPGEGEAAGQRRREDACAHGPRRALSSPAVPAAETYEISRSRGVSVTQTSVLCCSTIAFVLCPKP